LKISLDDSITCKDSFPFLKILFKGRIFRLNNFYDDDAFKIVKLGKK